MGFQVIFFFSLFFWPKHFLAYIFLVILISVLHIDLGKSLSSRASRKIYIYIYRRITISRIFVFTSQTFHEKSSFVFHRSFSKRGKSSEIERILNSVFRFVWSFHQWIFSAFVSECSRKRIAEFLLRSCSCSRSLSWKLSSWILLYSNFHGSLHLLFVNRK